MDTQEGQEPTALAPTKSTLTTHKTINSTPSQAVGSMNDAQLEDVVNNLPVALSGAPRPQGMLPHGVPSRVLEPGSKEPMLERTLDADFNEQRGVPYTQDGARNMAEVRQKVSEFNRPGDCGWDATHPHADGYIMAEINRLDSRGHVHRMFEGLTQHVSPGCHLKVSFLESKRDLGGSCPVNPWSPPRDAAEEQLFELLKQKARDLNYGLRHKLSLSYRGHPGVAQDPGGWFLLEDIQRAFSLDSIHVASIVRSSNKRRFQVAIEVNDTTGDMEGWLGIRCSTGHSVGAVSIYRLTVPVPIDLVPTFFPIAVHATPLPSLVPLLRGGFQSGNTQILTGSGASTTSGSRSGRGVPSLFTDARDANHLCLVVTWDKRALVACSHHKQPGCTIIYDAMKLAKAGALRITANGCLLQDQTTPTDYIQSIVTHDNYYP